MMTTRDPKVAPWADWAMGDRTLAERPPEIIVRENKQRCEPETEQAGKGTGASHPCVPIRPRPGINVVRIFRFPPPHFCLWPGVSLKNDGKTRAIFCDVKFLKTNLVQSYYGTIYKVPGLYSAHGLPLGDLAKFCQNLLPPGNVPYIL
jgi:hypothetical protein